MDSGYYKDVANRLRVEMDSRSPRLRLSIIGYLLDAKVPAEDVIERAGAILTFVHDDMETYLQMVESISTEESAPEKDAYEILSLKPKDGQGYL